MARAAALTNHSLLYAFLYAMEPSLPALKAAA